MPSKDLAQLIAWIGQHFGEIGEIRRVLDSLDRIPNEWKNIARLYMGISADDRSDARKIVDIPSNAMGDEDSRTKASDTTSSSTPADKIISPRRVAR